MSRLSLSPFYNLLSLDSSDDDEVKQPGAPLRPLTTQSLEGIVRHVIQPMLAHPTLSEEVQPYYCAFTLHLKTDNKSKLSALASCYIKQNPCTPYSKGVRFPDHMDVHGRIALSTRYTREENVRRELAGFTSWLGANLYITLGEARLAGMVLPNTWIRGRTEVALKDETTNLLDLMAAAKADKPYRLLFGAWSLYRRQRGVQHICHPAFTDMSRMACEFVDRARADRVMRLPKEKKQRLIQGRLDELREQAWKKRKLD